MCVGKGEEGGKGQNNDYRQKSLGWGLGGVCVGGGGTGTTDKTMIIVRKAWSSKCPPPRLYICTINSLI